MQQTQILLQSVFIRQLSKTTYVLGQGINLMLYKYIGAPNGESAVELLKCFVDKNTIMASHPASFNDPFEFKIALDLKAEEATIRSRYCMDNPSFLESEYNNWRDHLDNATRGITQSTRQDLLSTFGGLCLSSIGDNHLMWSHYASNHKGFCVDFDENQISAIPGVSWRGSVVYQNEAPIFRFFYDDQNEFTPKAFGYKSNLWAYEQEYRIVFEHSGIFTIPSAAILEIRLGCRAYPELRHFADDRCASVDNFWLQMREDFSNYRLSVCPVEKNVSVMSSFF